MFIVGPTPRENSGPLKINEAFKQPDFLSDTSKDETSDSDPEVKRKPHRLKKNLKLKEAPLPSTEHLNDTSCGIWEKNGHDLSDDSCISSDTSKREHEYIKFVPLRKFFVSIFFFFYVLL